MSWVNKVLVKGLNDGTKSCSWRIEVHSSGNDEIDLTAGNDDDEGKNSGPAVYIVQKMGMTLRDEDVKKNTKDDDKNEVISNVKVKFFGY